MLNKEIMLLGSRPSDAVLRVRGASQEVGLKITRKPISGDTWYTPTTQKVIGNKDFLVRKHYSPFINVNVLGTDGVAAYIAPTHTENISISSSVDEYSFYRTYRFRVIDSYKDALISWE